ncbi:MAG: hypothetical protein KGN79_03610 [Acidobacteriota bacterium]|nr:hypothetical protein [Acidobacteriota bacterium]
MELTLNLTWALLAATTLVCWSLKYWRMKNALGGKLLTLAVLLCILFPAVSISDDIWSLHNPAETDILLRRNDSATHAATHSQDIQSYTLTSFLVTVFALPAIAMLGRAKTGHLVIPFHEAPASFGLTIRPPPAL